MPENEQGSRVGPELLNVCGGQTRKVTSLSVVRRISLSRITTNVERVYEPPQLQEAPILYSFTHNILSTSSWDTLIAPRGTSEQPDCLRWDVAATGNEDIEVYPNTVNNTVLWPGESLQFGSGGRSDLPSGTMGRFSLVDARNGREIRHFYWDCPYSSSGNVWRITIKNKGFIVESQGENLKSGALGNITVEVVSNFAVPE